MAPLVRSPQHFGANWTDSGANASPHPPPEIETSNVKKCPNFRRPLVVAPSPVPLLYPQPRNPRNECQMSPAAKINDSICCGPLCGPPTNARCHPVPIVRFVYSHPVALIENYTPTARRSGTMSSDDDDDDGFGLFIFSKIMVMSGEERDEDVEALANVPFWFKTRRKVRICPQTTLLW